MPDTKFDVGESVLVPARALSNPNDEPYGLVERKVLAQNERSIRVDDTPGETIEVASRLVHSSALGFLVLRVGDLRTEPTLLDPLAKSVVQFLRLLVPDYDLQFVRLRTLSELDRHWTLCHGGTSHVILVGHGDNARLSFVDEGEVSGKAFAARLQTLSPDTPPKTFISLACKTGLAAFGKPFSESPICRNFIGPIDEIPAAAASQFCQALLSEHLLDGVEIPWAFRRAGQRVVGGRRFRRWRDGTRYVAPA
jgi:hypothetical protein